MARKFPQEILRATEPRLRSLIDVVNSRNIDGITRGYSKPFWSVTHPVVDLQLYTFENEDDEEEEEEEWFLMMNGLNWDFLRGELRNPYGKLRELKRDDEDEDDDREMDCGCGGDWEIEMLQNLEEVVATKIRVGLRTIGLFSSQDFTGRVLRLKEGSINLLQKDYFGFFFGLIELSVKSCHGPRVMLSTPTKIPLN
ncbi:hypothetical protein Ccrd_000738 [Cynara cardunculus var. scolymus]|uniref:Uncharacterized protein n=1 Tax=Cynara cardunculus var. scolymus TaxID=59895 RepID=A0A118JXY7_CYNCS|nr:hypothetical protein Ccrd_000738 [Cynara cardunculus var. scolymus]